MRSYHSYLLPLLSIACVALICLSTMIYPITFATIPHTRVISSGNDITLKVSKEYPALIATKSIDKTDVTLGETIIVTVIIRNFGNRTAYNVTYIERFSNPWIFNTTGLDKLSYAQIGPNETRVFGYSITANAIGKFSIQAAVIEYYDSETNAIRLITETNSIEITAMEPPEDISWANFYAALILLITIIMIDIMLLIRLIAPKFNRREQQANNL
ncbi:MAG: BatD family protein [Candidatus Heimdallarchaeota archaeon]